MSIFHISKNKKINFSVNEFIFSGGMSLRWFKTFIFLGKKIDWSFKIYFFKKKIEIFDLLKGVLRLEISLM